MATINSVRPSGANSAGSTTSRFNAYGVLVTPDGKLVFASVKDKTTAEIHLACIEGQWRAEFRYQESHGKRSGSAVPISVHTVPMATRIAAITDAAQRLRAESFVPHSTPSQARKQFGNSVAVPVVSAVAKAAAKFFNHTTGGAI